MNEPKKSVLEIETLMDQHGSSSVRIAPDGTVTVAKETEDWSKCSAPHTGITHPENMGEFAPHGHIFRNYTLLDLPRTCGACGAPVSYAEELLQRLLAGPSIRTLQWALPWGAHNYSRTFQAYPAPHRDFAHALLHVQKTVGKLSIAVDDADHNEDPAACFAPENIDRFIADLVVCALRLANTCPGRVVDLQMAIEERMKQKFPEGVP